MSWQENPFAVAVTTCVTTIAISATIVFTAVIPTWLKSKENEIAAQQAQILSLQAEPTKLKSEREELTGQLRKMETENLKLRRDLDRVTPDSLFSLDDVYPRGFRAVRIGDRIDLVSQVYGADGDITDSEGWISVRFKKPGLFSTIAYYYDEQAKVKTVTSILFQFGGLDSKSFDLLKEQLISNYSETAMKEETKRREKKLVWSGIQNHTLELAPRSFHISLRK